METFSCYLNVAFYITEHVVQCCDLCANNSNIYFSGFYATLQH